MTLHQSKDKIIFYKILKERKDNALAVVTVLRGIETYEVIAVMINFEVNKWKYFTTKKLTIYQ